MSNRCIITGTDTDVGKTVVAAMLTLALGATYWKPVQSGVEGGVDTKTVQRLTGLPSERFLPESYVFTESLSPHRAAEIDEAEIDVESLVIPEVDGPLIIEGAGGLMVPLTRQNLLINLFKRWNEDPVNGGRVPVILVARTGLGTINHTLLSLEALWSRKIPVHGLIFVGDENRDNMRTIGEFSDVKVLGRLPMLDSLNARSLTNAFEQNFDLSDF
ncbi:MAG: ATP-dependent dethiobiotin synthetase BioD [Rhodospirillales bacterium]|nr:ATP-dependent dethiobiotin synthetase BioD [Alphaproteobacteria bacterium]MCB9981230.1 ATP-dependent dethiobiotin synthetase BioD [Rhodospirillales bacterium]